MLIVIIDSKKMVLAHQSTFWVNTKPKTNNEKGETADSNDEYSFKKYSCVPMHLDAARLFHYKASLPH